jgi:hypothetical protein
LMTSGAGVGGTPKGPGVQDGVWGRWPASGDAITTLGRKMPGIPSFGKWAILRRVACIAAA